MSYVKSFTTEGSVRDLAISPDDTLVAVITTTPMFYVLDYNTFDIVYQYGHQEELYNWWFGTGIRTGWRYDGTRAAAILANWAAGEYHRDTNEIPNSWNNLCGRSAAYAFHYSPIESARAVAGGNYYSESRGFTQSQIFFGGHGTSIRGVRYNPTGNLVASSNSNGDIFIFEVAGDLLQDPPRFSKHKQDVYGIAWSEDGNYIISGDSYGIIYKWDINTGDILWKTDLHPDSTIMTAHNRGFRWAWDSNIIFIGNTLNMVYILDTNTGRQIYPLIDAEASILAIDVNSNETDFIVGTLTTLNTPNVRFFNFPTFHENLFGTSSTKCRTSIKINSSGIHSDFVSRIERVESSNNGKIYILERASREYIYDSETQEVIHKTRQHSIRTLVGSISPDGERILSTGLYHSGTQTYPEAIGWNAITGEVIKGGIRPLSSAVANPYRSAQFSRDGNYVGIGCSNGQIGLLDGNTFDVLETTADVFDGSWVRGISFNANNDKLAAISSSYVKTFNIPGLTLDKDLVSVGTYTKYTLDFHPTDNNKLCIGGISGRVAIYNIETDTLVIEDTDALGASRVYTVKYSHDGSMIAIGGERNEVRVLDANTLEILNAINLPAHTGELNSDGSTIAWSLDDENLIIGMQNGTVYFCRALAPPYAGKSSTDSRSDMVYYVKLLEVETLPAELLDYPDVILKGQVTVSEEG